MENYVLQKDEVVLYHGQVNVLPNGKKDPKQTKKEIELILTNYNFVFTTKTKYLLKRDTLETKTFNVKSVKFYKKKPHIIRKKEIVELYFVEGERFIEFPNKKEAGIFSNTALRLVSGNSKLVRAIKQMQQEVAETNEALGIDIVGAAKGALELSADVVTAVAQTPLAGSKTKTLAVIANVFKSKKEKKPKVITDKIDENPEN